MDPPRFDFEKTRVQFSSLHGAFALYKQLFNSPTGNRKHNLINHTTGKANVILFMLSLSLNRIWPVTKLQNRVKTNKNLSVQLELWWVNNNFGKGSTLLNCLVHNYHKINCHDLSNHREYVLWFPPWVFSPNHKFGLRWNTTLRMEWTVTIWKMVLTGKNIVVQMATQEKNGLIISVSAKCFQYYYLKS